MPKLPTIRPKELVRILLKKGFVKQRQKGSHLILAHFGKHKTTIIPIHNKPLGKGILAEIMRQTGLTRKDLSQ